MAASRSPGNHILPLVSFGLDGAEDAFLPKRQFGSRSGVRSTRISHTWGNFRLFCRIQSSHRSPIWNIDDILLLAAGSERSEGVTA